MRLRLRELRQGRGTWDGVARLYDPEVPVHLNAAYVAWAKEIRRRQDAERRVGMTSYTNRADRGWSPPGLADFDAEASKADK